MLDATKEETCTTPVVELSSYAILIPLSTTFVVGYSCLFAAATTTSMSCDVSERMWLLLHSQSNLHLSIGSVHLSITSIVGITLLTLDESNEGVAFEMHIAYRYSGWDSNNFTIESPPLRLSGRQPGVTRIWINVQVRA